jgi:AcrR family transcriptional regulator
MGRCEMNSKKLEKNELLYRLGYEEFSRFGYKNASLNSIIEKTGISKGSFYYRFNGKEDFYLFLATRALEKKEKIFREVALKKEKSGDIFDKLILQTEALIEYAFSNRVMYDFSRSFSNEKGNEIYERMLSSHTNDINVQFEEMISTAYRKGELREDLPEDFLVKSFKYYFMNLNGLLEVFGPLNDKDELLRYCLYFIETLKSGFKNRK